MSRTTVWFLAAISLAILTSGRALATSYVGFGVGPVFGSPTSIISYDTTVYKSPQTLKYGNGLGFEAQFGWDASSWIDFEGALRYDVITRSDTSNIQIGYTRNDVVGFEGGIRIHPPRGVTNSMPYIRAGVGSYSPSVRIIGGGGNPESEGSGPVLGYFVGAGYVQQITDKLGVDLRATAVTYSSSGTTYNANSQQYVNYDLKSTVVSVSLALIIF